MRGAPHIGLFRLIIRIKSINLRRHGGAAWLAVADLPTPEETKALTMPGDDSVRLHDHQGGSPIVPDPRQAHPEDLIGRRQFQPLRRRPR
jgi:hypothetical protein